MAKPGWSTAEPRWSVAGKSWFSTANPWWAVCILMISLWINCEEMLTVNIVVVVEF